MRGISIYSRKNVVSLVVIFCTIFWLLYSIGTFLYKSKKISDDIQGIKTTNEEIRAQIEEKKKELEYLKTPQRIEKEAKMQMGRKLPDEQVLVFVEEKIPFVSTPKVINELTTEKLSQVPIFEKWKWLFLGRSGRRR